MSGAAADIAFALGLFDRPGPPSTRKMMGGLSPYLGGTIFAILHADGSIRLKGAGGFAARMSAEGWHRWICSRDRAKTAAMPCWRLPDAALDDPGQACNLAREALREPT